MINITPKTNIKGESIGVNERYLTARETAARCGMGRATLYRAMERNQFPLSHQITEGRVGWLESDIEEWKRVGFNGFGLLYSEKVKQMRETNKAEAQALAQMKAA